jgi:long-chain fatty acid transport protein
MKKLLILLLSFFLTLPAFATNGDNMIAFGAKSRAMGGTGIAVKNLGFESMLKNPAMLDTPKKLEFGFGATAFLPWVTAQNETMSPNQSYDSASDFFFIPSIALVVDLGDYFTLGIGAFGTTGLGVDYRDSTSDPMAGLFGMSTSLSLLKMAVVASYHQDNWKLGIGIPVVMGSLGISYNMMTATPPADPMNRIPGTAYGQQFISPGTSNDFKAQIIAGAAYEFKDFVIGFNYMSPVKLEYDYQLTEAGKNFGLPITSNKLVQPAEIGAGVSYNGEKFTVNFDYKSVQWGKAEGYKSFGWENQNVYAVGLSYQVSDSIIRAGYNYGKSPLGDKALKNPFPYSAINIFNVVGFPAIVEHHVTAGLTQVFSDAFELDLALVYAPKNEATASMQMTPDPASAMDFNVEHSQFSITLGGRWMF